MSKTDYDAGITDYDTNTTLYDRNKVNYLMPFGKHKGDPLEQLPNNYVAWLLHDNIAKGFLKAALEEMIFQRIIKEKREDFIKAWVQDNFKARKSSSTNYDGPEPWDMGYDSPYDEWDAYGNLCVDFGM